jgi:hypothetical protein
MATCPDGGALALQVDAAQAVYPSTIDPILKRRWEAAAEAGPATEGVGAATAVSGDTAVIGAPGADQGAVYVFTRRGATWAQSQRLSGAEAGAGFGAAVALNGDTLVVGAPFHSVGANARQGAAFVFTRVDGMWVRRQELKASDGADGDYYGFSVAVSGDTLAVGAEGDDVGANASQGSVYVYARCGDGWEPRQKLTACDGAKGDDFGSSVAIGGETMAVGANGVTVGGNFGQGAVYVYTRRGEGWTPRQKLTAADGAADDQFGDSVAVRGGLVVVGAGPAGGAVGSGGRAVYLFTRGDELWSQRQKLTAVDRPAARH